MNFISSDCQGYADTEEALTTVEAGDSPSDFGTVTSLQCRPVGTVGAPQGLTRLITLQTFNKTIVEAGVYQQRAQIFEPRPSQELPNTSQTEQEIEILFSTARMYQDVADIRCLPKAP